MGRPIGIALLGSTGSIGRQALDVLESAGPERFRIVTLAAGSDAATLAEQARRVKPLCIALADADARRRLAPIDGVELLAGADAMEAMAVRDDVDLVVVGTGGVVSLRPVLAALRAGKVVATANKETLVAGGHLVMPLARERALEAVKTDDGHGLDTAIAWVRPIDSEHSALWQCLVGEELASVRRLILTASGGPFREWPASRLARARPADALAHPTWDMGAKITIDSATLMNKGLEVIEAHWLYDVDYDRIDVVIHPQSLIHSLVEFVDGSMKAQLGLPDMRIPIQYAVTYPLRQEGPAPRLDLVANRTMTFEAPDESRFRALSVARAAGRAGPRATTALIAADDVAVERFLAGSISFDGISQLVEQAVEHFGSGPPPDLDELESLDEEIKGLVAWRYCGDIGVIFDGLLNIVILLLILVGLVLVHELGHFVMARRAGVTVHEFGIGFPPRAAVLYRGKETVYTLNWLPIGGFVRLEGEEGESVDPHAFVNQRLATRLKILFAGVVVNFVLAWVIFSGIAFFADPVSNVRVGPVQPGSPAEAAGVVGAERYLVPPIGPFLYGDGGDTILAMNGQRFPVFDGIDAGTDAGGFVPPPIAYLREHAGETVLLDVRRADGSVEQLSATLRSADVAEEQGALGIAIIGLPREEVQNGVAESFVIGFERTVSASTLILRGVAELVGTLFNEGFTAEPPVAGPIGIAGVVGDVRSELPPVFMIWLVGLLSANLAIINILPFPPMDGGRVAMALVQALSRNRVSPAAERLVYLTGFVMLMALLVWVTAVDVNRLGG